ncbi:MAG: allantoinase [Gemmatimonadetes bacterium 13_1_40CM_70_11]|nr:MAG: allantoinase [Gemmatimonadetes bacterium 13_1_40CM_70_11]
MSTPDLVITSARVVTPEGEGPASIAIRDGVITTVSKGSGPDAARRIEVGASAVVMPGVVDTHVHVNEPGRTQWEGFETATRAAAAGGVTTIVDMPLNSVPVTTTPKALAEKARAAAGRAMVDYAFWGGVIPGNADDLALLARAGVRGFKCFLVPSGIDEFPPVTAHDLRPAMRRLAELGAVLLVHAESPGPIERAARAVGNGDPRRYDRWLASRPGAAELEAIELMVDLCRESGCAVHIVHLSSAEPIGTLDAARRAGLPVTVETCPHYLTFAAEEVPDGATAFKCAPPIREGAERAGLWAALARGSIDLVASDHSPAPPALKALDTGSFTQAWGGIASLELSLAATWTAAPGHGAQPADLARWLAASPARLAGLEARKGRIAPGYDADLVIWDPEASFTVEPASLHQRHPVTPYAGRRLQGVVRQTFVRGVCVYDNGRFPSRPVGAWISPEAP